MYLMQTFAHLAWIVQYNHATKLLCHQHGCIQYRMPLLSRAKTSKKIISFSTVIHTRMQPLLLLLPLFVCYVLSLLSAGSCSLTWANPAGRDILNKVESPHCPDVPHGLTPCNLRLHLVNKHKEISDQCAESLVYPSCGCSQKSIWDSRGQLMCTCCNKYLKSCAKTKNELSPSLSSPVA